MKISATSTFTPSMDVSDLMRSIIVPELMYAADDSAKIVLEASQALVPVRTGELRSSGHTEGPEDDGSAVMASVVYDAEHAMFVETGTGIRGAASAGALPDATYSPTWPGMAAQPYARPALDQSRGAINERFGKINI